MSERLARCPAPACPVRYAAGDDRKCHEHADSDEGLADRLTALTGTMAAPGGDGEPAPLNSRIW